MCVCVCVCVCVRGGADTNTFIPKLCAIPGPTKGDRNKQKLCDCMFVSMLVAISTSSVIACP